MNHKLPNPDIAHEMAARQRDISVSEFFLKNRHLLGFDSPTQDIVDYSLEDATHPLTKPDIKRAHDAIKNDPFFATNSEWIAAIEQLLTMGVRAEQQALAKWGLNYVIDECLPGKLANQASFLP